MGKLSEKETEIEIGPLKASFLALYNNGELQSVLMYLEANGHCITFDYSNEHGGHRIIESGKTTRCFNTLRAFINPEFYTKIESQLNVFKNEKP